MRRSMACVVSGLLVLALTACSSSEEQPAPSVTNSSDYSVPFAPNAGLQLHCEADGARVSYLSPNGDGQLEEAKAAFSLSEPQKLGDTCQVMVQFASSGLAGTGSIMPPESGVDSRDGVVEPHHKSANDIITITVREGGNKANSLVLFQDDARPKGQELERSHSFMFFIPASYLK